ncbi:MAG TPA: DUF4401 domain-containing protein [Steroidobacteraceae bacterium]|jgi:hypothetical protein|nr:DUF4401 domain-containing protein [Steroidobacteraceae bacterium]
MSVAAIDALLEQLRARNVIAPDVLAPAPADEHRPWYVMAMTGAAGWLAGVFLLAFIGIAFKIDSRVAIGVIGVVLLGAAWSLYFADRRAVFLDQLALALSIAGQMALAWSFLAESKSGLIISAALLALQLFVLLIMPNKTARSIAALFAIFCWVYVVRFALHPARGGEAFFAEGFNASRMSLAAALTWWLLTWAPLVAFSGWLIARESRWMSGPLRRYLRPILVGLLLALAVGGVASEPFVLVLEGVGGVDSIGYQLSAWAVFPLLSLSLAMYAAYCAFRLSSNGLTGFAVFAALLHLARFYYLYGTSLTWKALIMACLGVALLGAGWWLKQRAGAVST